MAVDLIARGMAENDDGGIYTGGSHISVDNDTKIISTDLHAGTNIEIDEDGAINALDGNYFTVTVTNLQALSGQGSVSVYTGDADKTIQDVYEAMFLQNKRCLFVVDVPFIGSCFIQVTGVNNSFTSQGFVGTLNFLGELNGQYYPCSLVAEYTTADGFMLLYKEYLT